jgi:hypothetical protein
MRDPEEPADVPLYMSLVIPYAAAHLPAMAFTPLLTALFMTSAYFLAQTTTDLDMRHVLRRPCVCTYPVLHPQAGQPTYRVWSPQ